MSVTLLSNQQIVDCRRYMGYSVTGDPESTPYRELVYSNVSYMGLSLDYRLTHLDAHEAAIVCKFLDKLSSLEEEIYGASDNLDTEEAAVWKRNKSEVSDRINHYTWHRRELCTFLGFPPGPQLSAGNRIVRA